MIVWLYSVLIAWLNEFGEGGSAFQLFFPLGVPHSVITLNFPGFIYSFSSSWILVMEFGVFAFFFFPFFAFCALFLLSYLIGIFHIGTFGLTYFFSRSTNPGLHALFSTGRMRCFGEGWGSWWWEDLLKERKPGILSAEEWSGILWLGYMSILGYRNMGIILYIFSQRV